MASDRLRKGAFAVLFILGVITKLHALLECHCNNGCDVNYRCISGSHCAVGWTGPTCQIENIALGKNTNQSGIFDDCPWAKGKMCGVKSSSLAVDGRRSSDYWSGTCTHTNPHLRPVWWSVDLGTIHLVNSIKIYFSNTSTCYLRDNTSQPSSPISIICIKPVYGRDVKVELTRDLGADHILNLCEVEVYGDCTSGSFGHECGQSCNCGDVNEICNKTTGHCNSGCVAGYRGRGCQHECEDRRFGVNCSHSCLCKDWSEVCDKVTGHCSSGCPDGHHGPGCSASCLIGQYGPECRETCGHCSGESEKCDPVNGNCTEGCQNHWMKHMCKDCENGWFGVECDQECKCKDIYEICNKTTGQCVESGCEDGWTGLDCYTECENGTYGYRCSYICGRCLERVTCGKIEGVCATGCEEGFAKPLCQNCSEGFYGPDCKICSQCRGNVSCDRDTGRCPEGCLPGWKGVRCQQECENGTYGDNCSLTCGQCLGGTACGNIKGECPECEKGFSTPLCKECEVGSHGLNCSHQCGRCVGQCDPVGGNCDKEGCMEGLTDPKCDKQCGGGSYGVNCSHRCGHCAIQCDKVDGSCGQQGCMDGWIGQDCNRNDFRKWTLNIAASGSAKVFDFIESRSPDITVGTASVTTDGNTSLTTCVTISGTQPSWRINFKKQHVIHGLAIYMPSLGYLFDLNVLVDGATCYHWSSLPQFPGQNVVPCYEPVLGRSVIIYNPRDDAFKNLTLCEVQIYAGISDTTTTAVPVSVHVIAAIASCIGILVTVGSVLVLVFVARRRKLGCFKPKGDEQRYEGLKSTRDANKYTSINVQVNQNEPPNACHVYQNEPPAPLSINRNEPPTVCEESLEEEHIYVEPRELSDDRTYEEVAESNF